MESGGGDGRAGVYHGGGGGGGGGGGRGSPKSFERLLSPMEHEAATNSLFNQIVAFTLFPAILMVCLYVSQLEGAGPTAALGAASPGAGGGGGPRDSLDYITSLARRTEITAESAVKIPHILHILWLEEEDPFGERRAASESWSELFFEAHPQWSIIVWTMDELRGMRMQNRKTFELYDIPAAAKRDIAAIEVLNKFGGVVVDPSCYWGGGSLDQVLADSAEHSFFAARQPAGSATVLGFSGLSGSDSLLAHWMIGSSPMHPILMQAEALLPSMVSKIRKRTKNQGRRTDPNDVTMSGGVAGGSQTWDILASLILTQAEENVQSMSEGQAMHTVPREQLAKASGAVFTLDEAIAENGNATRAAAARLNPYVHAQPNDKSLCIMLPRPTVVMATTTAKTQ